ncbi:hypothetical protein R3P38DRAFT_3181095 [Favolaschia claudopus]|uniref:Uncharacterized protein n=1 Tax=Favolaschia claudopus TaxID=2862362 RepID=A0AAW0CHU6_9AGAR
MPPHTNEAASGNQDLWADIEALNERTEARMQQHATQTARLGRLRQEERVWKNKEEDLTAQTLVPNLFGPQEPSSAKPTPTAPVAGPMPPAAPAAAPKSKATAAQGPKQNTASASATGKAKAGMVDYKFPSQNRLILSKGASQIGGKKL